VPVVRVVLTEMQQSPNPFRPGFGHDAGVAHSFRTLAFLLALAAAAPAAGARSPYLPTPPYGGPRQIVLFGHIASLKPSGQRWVLRFDPELMLSGRTASDYAFEKTGSHDVPNDHVLLDPDHTLLTFLVPAYAHATVMTNRGTQGIRATRVSLASLAQLAAGHPPKSLHAFEPRSPFWIVVRTDTVLSLDQQYLP
jgi:hypothetical protein